LISVHFLTCVKAFLKPGQICPGYYLFN